MNVPSQRLTVGLLWHSVGSGNLGVGALTVSQVAIIEEIAREIGVDVDFRILGWSETDASYPVSVNVMPGRLRTVDLVHPNGLYSDARECDLILDIGAGDSFSDIYGRTRFLKYMLAKFVVHFSETPLIVSPQTIGPFFRWWARVLAFSTLRRSAAVFTRDEQSLSFLREFGFNGSVHVSSDVALVLPFERSDRSRDTKDVYVGINISGLLMSGGYSRNNMFGLNVNYGRLMRRVIERFLYENNCRVILVPHVISERLPVDDDWRSSVQLAEEFGGLVTVAPKFSTPNEAKSFIAGMDFFVGARMHSCIAALSSGVPVVPIAYSRKFSGLFDAIGYHYTQDCTQSSELDIEGQIFEIFRNRVDVARDCHDALVRGMSRLDIYKSTVRAGLVSAIAKRDRLCAPRLQTH